MDREEKKLFVFSSEMLINQLRREGPKIEESFDKLCHKELRELSELLSEALSLIFSGLHIANKRERELERAIAELLMNACNSFAAATALLRMGYVLQPGIVIRSLLEAVSTVFHLKQHPEDLVSYKNHDLPSPKTIAAAKNALPPFGRLYGSFSDNFAHIGELHKSVNRVTEFKEMEAPLQINLSFLRIAAWLLYVAAEFAFNELLDLPRYWHPIPNGYTYNPSQEEKIWMSNFFRMSDGTA